MKALITGASGGIGRDIAHILSEQGYDLILVARSRENLESLQKELPTHTEIIPMDLSEPQAPHDLYEQVKDQEIDILINNAGFGLFGAFTATDLDTELNMIDLNIKALHVLTKLFLRDFVTRDAGYILNVSSIAGFLPGPLMSSYYASKAYVLRLTQAIYEELRQSGSHVHISALCPGPVRTGFNERAGARFGSHGLPSEVVAAFALKKMFAGKLIIVPGFPIKALRFAQRIFPDKLLLKAIYHTQTKRKSK
jgi:short-subunit dehydrogenase